MLRSRRVLDVLIGALFAAFIFIPAHADGGTIAKVRAWHVTCNATAPTSFAPPAAAGNLAGAQSYKFLVGATGIFLGGTDLTIANTATKGFAYSAAATDSFDAHPESVFCVTASSTSDVSILAGKF